MSVKIVPLVKLVQSEVLAFDKITQLRLITCDGLENPCSFSVCDATVNLFLGLQRQVE